MDPVELDVIRKRAGAEYLTALEGLGLRPEALFWAYDNIEQRFVLVLATEMFDFKGPLAVSQLLFKAFNAAATPKEIDPFVVRLHSPDHAIIREFDGWKFSGSDNVPHYGLDPTRNASWVPGAIMNVESGGLTFNTGWVYRYRLPKRIKQVEMMRRWRRFSSNVDRLAA